MSEQRSAPRGTHRAPTGRSALGTGARPASGMGAVLQESEFSAADAIGGWRGAIESVAPTLLFVVLFMATRSIAIAAVAAVAACAIAVIVRLAQRQSVGSAVGGLLGVGIGAVWAVRSGSGTDFYLPGILTNAATLAIVLISILARRPLVGFIAALFDPPHLHARHLAARRPLRRQDPRPERAVPRRCRRGPRRREARDGPAAVRARRVDHLEHAPGAPAPPCRRGRDGAQSGRMSAWMAPS